ncbi:hypothetical protein MSG28_000818 [Choristoneura fumiferana]|uniref:Uncharacterized protein n=1 Tax=Choristoneura fumiferana TaxID=7141 RepID=A0ACC0K2J0_CHOFU|nr:hypothetical protein MSG28_000818 [Choristoneura fumiferana]
MIDSFKLKGWLRWPLIRAHLCTLAAAVSFNSTWRVPREAFRYGGVSYLLVLTVAMVVIALPGTLLQLAIGQLSQQDAVGVWRAVPFFKGPLVFLLLLVLSFCIGNSDNFATIQRQFEWRHYMESNIWHSAVTQALWSSQIAGGFLISSGDTIYFSTNVQWSSLAIIATNIILSWFGMLFWFAVAGSDERDVSALAVLVQMFKAAEYQELNVTWPLLVFAALFFSGIITMLTLLYPLYDRFRRAGGHGWRLISFSSSLVGAAAALGVLVGRLPALALLEDIAVPLLISIATVFEIVAFVFIYGWKPLVEDVEFLTGRELVKSWVMGWCAAPGIILPFTIWWLVMLFSNTTDWTEPPWDAITVVAVTSLSFVIFFAFAIASVIKQVQYDCLGKVKTSFQPSRHWGPRDPITHYYWLARREEVGRGNLPSRYNRRQLGQMSGGTSFLNIPQEINTNNKFVQQFSADKKRSNSDDWLYTRHRKEYIAQVFHISAGKMRSKSLEYPVWPAIVTKIKSCARNKDSVASSNYVTPPEMSGSMQYSDHETTDTDKNEKTQVLK